MLNGIFWVLVSTTECRPHCTIPDQCEAWAVCAINRSPHLFSGRWLGPGLQKLQPTSQSVFLPGLEASACVLSPSSCSVKPCAQPFFLLGKPSGINSGSLPCVFIPHLIHLSSFPIRFGSQTRMVLLNHCRDLHVLPPTTYVLA